ncbi:hypothetical protein [Chenggangzhangella methanolivorans]|uniref:Uncharacterized protein n=1 Tax=Chenggangzhangella methanolivorans TaxID=1437009 RepID=A0A9E6RBD3_9HYPH|nr:hypothetical protein [Chenggangzhangella methanolivorans]QZO01107.1 hypothetical protein K6K41_05915 [Chenggangzhangella methanolivorans]
MPDAAEKLFEDESVEWTEAVVDELIIRARGDERAAIRELVIELAEVRAAVSLGYLRGVQPERPR